MPAVFISYRRRDSAAAARDIKRQLETRFGPESVFMDVEIGAGHNFVDRIENALTRSAVLLAVIGDRWLESEHHSGTRLNDPNDWVRWEIEAALQRRIPVVPVLVSDAALPATASLPPSLRAMLNYNAIELHDDRWDLDVARLVDTVGTFYPTTQEDEPLRRLAAPPDLREGVLPQQLDGLLGVLDRVTSRSAVQTLKNVLARAERVYHVETAKLKAPPTAKSDGILAITDRRFIWAADNLDLSWSVPWGDVEKVLHRPSRVVDLPPPRITLTVRGTDFVFSSVWKGETAARFVAGLAPRVAEVQHER